MKEKTIKGFAIGGAASGVGKTTVSLGLMAAMRQRGLKVQPFKCGPDFIDPGYHAQVCGRPARNLDSWMLPEETNRRLFFSAARDSDVCVVEGVMGLFDGASGKSAVGSTAEMAKLLGLPVILVVDGSAMAQSAAAVVRGFESFDPELRLAGVIFNKAGGPGHIRMLREAVEEACSTPFLGYLPQDAQMRIPERYLGLHTAEENPLTEEAISALRNVIESNVNVEQLLALLPEIQAEIQVPPAREPSRPQRAPRIGVARDLAFCFYYEDNLDALRSAGAEIIDFSPIDHKQLPPLIDALYFGGGYPELYAGELARNHEMLGAIRKFGEDGGVVYAECGGLMLLGEEIVDCEGCHFPMAGLLPLRVQMTGHLVKFGYAEVTLKEDSLWGPAGTKARGHSFHHSAVVEAGDTARHYRLCYSSNSLEEEEGFGINNVLASYIHLHFLSNPDIAPRMVANVWRASEARKGRMPG